MKKVAAGVDFIQTQIILDIPRFREFMKRVVDMGLHEKVYILAGIGPLKSAGAARYMRDKVPGMRVRDEYVERMEAAVAGIPKEDKKARKEAWEREGIRIAIEQIQEIREIPAWRVSTSWPLSGKRRCGPLWRAPASCPALRYSHEFHEWTRIFLNFVIT
jgi:5,10-methylenetetrahydrofolate reductase